LPFYHIILVNWPLIYYFKGVEEDFGLSLVNLKLTIYEKMGWFATSFATKTIIIHGFSKGQNKFFLLQAWGFNNICIFIVKFDSNNPFDCMSK
jgi:hypothetical protein